MKRRYDLVVREEPIEMVRVGKGYLPVIDRTIEVVGYDSNVRLVEKSGKGGLIDISY